MELKEIITDEYALSDRAEEIDVRKEGKLAQQIVVDLKKIIREKNLKSLSAPQIGYNKRIFVVNFNGDLRTFVNPIISSAKGFDLSKETCSSIPEKTFIRPRNTEVVITYQTPMGKIESRKFMGLAATVLQHSIDHLDGLLLCDIGLEIDEGFENASEEERFEIIHAYMDSLDIKHKEIEKVIEEDSELKEMSDAIRFIEQVQKGNVQIEEQVI